MNKYLFQRIAVCLGVIAVVAGCPPPEEKSTPVRGRMLQDQIDSGQISLSEIRDFGRELSLMNFDLANGFGNGRDGAEPPNFSRLVGPDTTSCNGCHGQNNVVMGWGNNSANLLVAFDDAVNPTVAGSNERNTPMVHGTGLVELLSIEMSLDLRAQRDAGLEQAAQSGQPVTVNLETKGVEYGSLTCFPDGTVDYSELEGTDFDLRIRPFHHKGQESTNRIFARSASDRHMGIQSYDLLRFKDPTQDPKRWDEDEDGMIDEMSEGELTALTVFNVTLPAPVETGTGDPDVEAGRELMTAFNCVECHEPSLRLEDPIWRDTSDAGVTLEIDLTDPALGTPRVPREPDGSVLVELWSDLKRHDLGPEAHEPLDQPVDNTLPNWDGGLRGERLPFEIPDVPKELMLTTKLWGVGDTGPWWHDGSSPTIDDAIRRHGGEAQASKEAYVNATEQERQQLLAFLNQLQVGLVGEVFFGAKDDSEVDPRNLPLNSVTQYWEVPE